MGVGLAYFVIVAFPVELPIRSCLVYQLPSVHYIAGILLQLLESLSKPTGRCIKVLQECVIG